ncbi:MAG TPA: hypothetical protein G4O11_08535 [Anaerolineae bacterium]|nr:hypothetical protein [Anaerolineae bacterium]
MTKLLNEIKDDLDFIKSHTLQPGWYKILKIFLVIGFLLGYYFLFGILKTVLFFAVFFFLSFLVHLVYRSKTDKWRRSWLDFVVIEENNEIKAESIGKFYYSAIIINATLSLIISQVLG